MSKIGQLPVQILSGANVEVSDKKVLISGPKGNLSVSLPNDIEVKVEGQNIIVSAKKDNKATKSNWGTVRMLLSNSIKGVTEGWKKQLELVGTGYRSEVQGNKLVLTVGYSHPIVIEAPEGITFKVEKSIVNVDGIDKQLVGQISANIRASRPPEPYKGKGVKYVGEYIRRKAGKAAKAAA